VILLEFDSPMLWPLLGEKFPKALQARCVREFLLFRCAEDREIEDVVEHEKGAREEQGESGGRGGRASEVVVGGSFVRDRFRGSVVGSERILSEVLVRGVASGKKMIGPVIGTAQGIPRIVDMMVPGVEARGTKRNAGPGKSRLSSLESNSLESAQPMESTLDEESEDFSLYGERFDVAMFPELFLDEERRFVAGTCIECRSVSGSRMDSSMVTGWTEGRFVVNLDQPWEELISYRRQPGIISLVIARSSPWGIETVTILGMEEADKNILNADLPVCVLGQSIVQIGCQYCNGQRKMCECASHRRRLSGKPKSFPEWLPLVNVHRIVPPASSTSLVQVWTPTRTLTSSWQTMDLWANSAGWGDSVRRCLIPMHLNRAWKPFPRIELLPPPQDTASWAFREWNPVEEIPQMDEKKKHPSTQRSRSLPCHMCNRSFCRPSYLNSHIDAVHGEGKFNCQFCGKSLSSMSNLNRHRRSVHDKVRNYFCCSKAFFSSSDYRRHRERMHSLS